MASFTALRRCVEDRRMADVLWVLLVVGLFVLFGAYVWAAERL